MNKHVKALTVVIFLLLLSAGSVFAANDCDNCYPMKEDQQREIVEPDCEEMARQIQADLQSGRALRGKKAMEDHYGIVIEYDEALFDAKFNFCGMKYDPPDLQKSAQLEQAAGTPLINALGSGCPCNGGISVTTEGCHIKFTCNIQGDQRASVEVTTPCPTVRGSDPKYPLVKMLSGTLIEWNESPVISDNTGGYLSRGAAGGTGGPGDFYGAEAFQGVHFSYVVSSIDIGQNVKFSIDRANAKKNAKNPLDRSNFIFNLVGGSPYVEVLNQHDIYDAYKARNKYVQAYTVLAGKGYKERPWTTYDKFVDAMCDMSTSKYRCKKELAYHGHRDTEMQGNLYLGNGDMSIIGLYSEVSSHGCHGATVINDKGQPAFGITIQSTWCFYIRAQWGNYSTWELDKMEKLEECCEGMKTYNTGRKSCSLNEFGEEVDCVDIYRTTCSGWHAYWLVEESWHQHGGGSSSGDCGVCQTATGYIDENGKETEEPLAISFYQSQPLLIREK